jgi:hypothetical protein
VIESQSKRDGQVKKKNRSTFLHGTLVKCLETLISSLLKLELGESKLTETPHHIIATNNNCKTTVLLASGYKGSNKT